MKISTVEIVSLRAWCQPVAEAAVLTRGPRANLIWQAHPGESFDIPPPDLVADPADIADIGRDGRKFLVQLDGSRMTVDPTTLARLHGVTLRNGCKSILLSDSLLIAESYHNAWIQDALRAAPMPYRRMRMNIQYRGQPTELSVKVHEVDRPDQVLDGPAVLIDGRWSNNYCHWMIECLPKLWCLDALPALRTLPLVVPGRLSRFHVDTLTALGIPPERLIHFTGRFLRAETLFVPSCLTPAAYAPRQVAWLRDTLRRAYGLEQVEATDLLYVSRAKARVRRVVDEPAIIERLQRRKGFRMIHAEDLSMKEQVEAFARARVIVSPNGSGTTNLVFAAPGSAVIDLVPGNSHHPIFWAMTRSSGMRYGRILCPTVAPHDDLVVDPAKLDALLDQAGA